ncbi:MAG: hypothetical protein LW860_07755 [Xanthomonadaceae bacterium]|jgi:hypothetical protein|nr:hypothetical protein [Xanthomonadaceae bacterium]
MRLASLLFAAVVSVALPALASDGVFADRAPSVADIPVTEFLAFYDEIDQRAAKGEFKDLSRGDREALDAAQSRIRATVSGKQRMTELSEPQRLTVFNDHQRVVALLDKAEESRVICEQVKRVGSHRHSVECRSVAERRRDRENSQLAARTVRKWPY